MILLWKDVQQVKGNGERLGVGGPSFAHRRLGDHSELENRYGRELSEHRDWGSPAVARETWGSQQRSYKRRNTQRRKWRSGTKMQLESPGKRDFF